MMEHVKRLLDNNRRWVAAMTEADPHFFAKRVDKQEPHFLFIGCSDSRVPAETLTGAQPGEMFVHRNIANQVSLADLNVLSVLEFAIEVRQALLNARPDVVAIELPATLQPAYLQAVYRLPEMSVLLYPGGEDQERDRQQYRQTCGAFFDPGEALAAHLGRENPQ